MTLSTAASAVVFMEKRKLFEVFPNSLIKFLTEWEVRVLIILSLTLQILLITLGNRRKYICKIWIRITLWCAYLLADWVATVSLGIISKNTLDECQKERDVKDPALNQLMWFWAQFFLLHLGGSDTITAYSLEDNELWLRHLVGLVIQTGIAFYILLVAFPAASWLPVMSTLIFIAGLIKYGERLFALRAANSENFRDSMLKEPDSGPNYAKFMEEYTLKKAEGFYVEAAEVIEIPVQDQHSYPNDSGKLIAEAYEFYLTFKCLFADAILSFQDRDRSQPYFQNLSPKQAFDVVEVELGFMFDELYTKASIVYKEGGWFVLRTITFSFTFFSLMAFIFFCDKSGYEKLDLIITYLLLVVAIFLEIYAVCIAVNSDWTRNWLSRHKGKALSSLIIRLFQQSSEKRWSKKMAQHNLLDLCVRGEGTVCLTTRKFLWSNQIDNYLEKHWYKYFLDVSQELQELIFKELDSYTRIHDYNPTSFWNWKGSFTLEKYGSLSRTKQEEFDQRILIWHIATDICYSLENSKTQISEHSKQISDYMLYLLIACPFMLPIGIGMIRFRDTCAEVKEFLEERNVKHNKVKACEKLLKVNTEVAPGKVKGDRSKSVLFDACRMAKSLMERKEEKWEIISKVWVELLAYAATHCRGNHHARQLRKGGELITHVWLLMAHLGITEQFQIYQGHARAKLIVK